MISFASVKIRFFILICFLFGSVVLYGQSVSPIPEDSILLESIEVANPFDVDHIPIRKNQINQSNPEYSMPTHQVEKHFALIVIISLLFFLATIITMQKDFFTSVFLSMIRQSSLVDIWRMHQKGKSKVILLAHLFGLGSLSLFCCLALWPMSQLTRWQLFGLLLGGIVLYYFLKFGIHAIIKAIFTTSDAIFHYQSQTVTVNILVGVLLLMISIFLAFGPDIWIDALKYLGLFVIISGVLIKVFRTAIQLSSSIIRHAFQYFIYLCTLEIGPLLVIWRLINF